MKWYPGLLESNSNGALQQIEPILWKYGKSAEFELFRGSKEVPFSRNFECE